MLRNKTRVFQRYFLVCVLLVVVGDVSKHKPRVVRVGHVLIFRLSRTCGAPVFVFVAFWRLKVANFRCRTTPVWVATHGPQFQARCAFCSCYRSRQALREELRRVYDRQAVVTGVVSKELQLAGGYYHNVIYRQPCGVFRLWRCFCLRRSHIYSFRQWR